MLKKPFLILLLSFQFIALNGQSLSVYEGRFTQVDEVLVPIINPNNISRTKPIKGFYIAFPVTKKLHAGFVFDRFSGWNNIGSKGSVGTFGYGSARTHLKRYGLLFQYELNINEGRMSFLPLLGLNIENSVPQQPDGLIVTNIFDGSNSRGQYKGYAEVRSFKGQQFLPTLGIGFRFKIIAGLHFIADYRWSFGNRVFQEMLVHYSYDDIPQPTAHVVNKGSGFIRTFGVSYDFKLMKPLFK